MRFHQDGTYRIERTQDSQKAVRASKNARNSNTFTPAAQPCGCGAQITLE